MILELCYHFTKNNYLVSLNKFGLTDKLVLFLAGKFIHLADGGVHCKKAKNTNLQK